MGRKREEGWWGGRMRGGVGDGGEGGEEDGEGVGMGKKIGFRKGSGGG